MSTEIAERRHLRHQLDRALIDLDTDSLRFVLVVALLRGMTFEELTKVEQEYKQAMVQRGWP